jgi:hypothetical protein
MEQFWGLDHTFKKQYDEERLSCSGKSNSRKMKQPSVEETDWRNRFIRSGYFLAALLAHLAIFVLLATLVVFKAPQVEEQSGTFLKVAISPPPLPPTPPPSSGGDVRNNLEPDVQVTPPITAPSVIISPSVQPTFNVPSAKIAAVNLPAAISKPVGTDMTGMQSPGDSSGSGSPFGSSDSSGSSELEGTLFDLKQTPDHQPTGMTPGKYHEVLKRFISADWDPNILSQYYKASVVVHASYIFIPIIPADLGPKAFGVEKEVKPDMYVIWYHCKSAPPQDGTYHFVGNGDDILAARVDGRTVFDGSLKPIWSGRQDAKKYAMTDYADHEPMHASFWIGEAFQVSGGQPVDIDVLIGEEPGGWSNYFLYIQRDESTYHKQANGTPLLPVFQITPDPVVPHGKPSSYPPFSAIPEPWTPWK